MLKPIFFLMTMLYCIKRFYLFSLPTAPYGEEVPVHISGNTKTGLRIDYTPQEVGQ